jgi:hypothetical protein
MMVKLALRLHAAVVIRSVCMTMVPKLPSARYPSHVVMARQHVVTQSSTLGYTVTTTFAAIAMRSASSSTALEVQATLVLLRRQQQQHLLTHHHAMAVHRGSVAQCKLSYHIHLHCVMQVTACFDVLIAVRCFILDARTLAYHCKPATYLHTLLHLFVYSLTFRNISGMMQMVYLAQLMLAALIRNDACTVTLSRVQSVQIH